MAECVVQEIVQGKTIDNNGVVVVTRAMAMSTQTPAHGAKDIRSYPIIGLGDVTGPITQIKYDVWEVGGYFQRHGHNGDQPMGEWFGMLSGEEVTFSYSPPGELERHAVLHPGGSIYFPPGVEHRAWNSGRKLADLIVVGIREVEHPCDAGKKGVNIPAIA